MRKTLFTIIFFFGFCLHAFSQSSISPDIIHIQPKTSYRNDLLANIGSKFYFNDSINFKKLPDFCSRGKVANDQKLLETKFTNEITNMPVLKPDGIYSMQILIPDSTINYTLLTKEYPRR